LLKTEGILILRRRDMPFTEAHGIAYELLYPGGPFTILRVALAGVGHVGRGDRPSLHRPRARLHPDPKPAGLCRMDFRDASEKMT